MSQPDGATVFSSLGGSGRVAHRHPVQLRFGDFDVQHHVNNVVYLRFIEDARIALLRRLGVRGPVRQVVRKLEIDYLHPIEFGTPKVEVAVWNTRVGRTSYETRFHILDQGRVACEATSVVVHVDREGKPKQFSERMRDRLARDIQT
jgi:acyl-CoA thioester hydrolase